MIDKAREVYRPVAARGSLHFFLVDKLNALAHMYQYSMANYVDILNKVRRCPGLQPRPPAP